MFPWLNKVIYGAPNNFTISQKTRLVGLIVAGGKLKTLKYNPYRAFSYFQGGKEKHKHYDKSTRIVQTRGL